MKDITPEEKNMMAQASLLLVASGMPPSSAEEASKALMEIVPDVEQRAAYLASRTALNAAGMLAALRIREKPMSAASRAIFTAMLVLLENTTETVRNALAYKGEDDGPTVKH